MENWWKDFWGGGGDRRTWRKDNVPGQLAQDRNLRLRSDKIDSVFGRTVKYKALVGKAVRKRLDGSAVCNKTCCGNGGLGRGLQAAS